MEHLQPSTRAIKRSKRINQYQRVPLRSLKMKETLRAHPLSTAPFSQINDHPSHAAANRRTTRKKVKKSDS